jgi:2-methylcitrate dehydratase PrpD
MTLVGDDELSRAMPVRQGIVTLVLENGNTLREHTRAVRGTPPNPMTREELEDKCRELLVPVLGDSRSAELCAAVWKLEKVADGRALAALLVPPH